MSVGPDEWNPAAPSESSTDFDGLFSWAGESHAFAIGFGVGLTADPTLMTAFVGYALADMKVRYDFTDDPHVRQVTEEPAYALGGMAIGYIVNTRLIGGSLLGVLPSV